MNEQEIANLVVRLIGDPSSFVKMLTEAEAQATKTEKEVRTLLERIEGFTGKLEHIGEQVEHVLRLFGAGFSLKEAFNVFSKAEQEELKLEAAIRANGDAVEDVMDSYKKYAEEVQRTTTIDDDAALGLLRLAHTYELSGDAAIEASRKALQFAGAVDGTAKSASSYIAIAAAMEKGDMERVRRYARMIPQLRGIRDETELLEKATKLLTTGQSMLDAEAESASGKLQQLKNDFENVLESFGKLIAQGIMPGVKWLKALVAVLQGTPEWLQKSIVLLLASVVAWNAFLILRSPILSAYGAIKVAALAAWSTTTIQAWTVAAGGAVVVLAAVALAYYATSKAAQEYTEAVERAIKTQQNLQGAIGGAAQGGIARLANLPIEERKKQLEANIKMLDEQVKSGREELQKQRSDFESRASTQITDIFRPSLVAKQRELYKEQAKTFDEMAKAAAKLRAELKSIQETGIGKELAEAFKEAEKNAVLAYEAVGKSADEMARRKLEMQGLPFDKLLELEKLQELGEGRKFMEQFTTEQERMAKKLADANRLFLDGALTVEEYDYAVQKLTKSIKDLVTVQAVEAGSLEDIKQEAKYRMFLEDNRLQKPGPPKAGELPLLQNKQVLDRLTEIRDAIRDDLKKKKAQIDVADLQD